MNVNCLRKLTRQIHASARRVSIFPSLGKRLCVTFFIILADKTIGIMACNADILQYIVDQCSGAGRIDVKKMMGDYCIYCDGILFGLVCDDNLFIKVTDAGRSVLREEILRAPYPGAKDYFFIDDVDDSDYLTQLIKVTIPNLPKPKRKQK